MVVVISTISRFALWFTSPKGAIRIYDGSLLDVYSDFPHGANINTLKGTMTAEYVRGLAPFLTTNDSMGKYYRKTLIEIS